MITPKPLTAESPHLTVAQLADRWQTTKKAIYNMRSLGTAPPCFKRGRNLMFPLGEVEAHERAGMHAQPRAAAA
jgi:predicted DNA-binding transcriptional regulator AlpA